MKKLPKFRASAIWLKQATEALGYAKEASQIRDYWCWKEIGAWSKTIPDDLHESLLRILIASGYGWACYLYCKHVKDRDDVRKAMIESGDGFACYEYCKDVKDTDDVRQAMIESGDGFACYEYCKDVKDTDDVRQAMIDSGYGYACYWYCRNIEDRDDVRAVFEKQKESQ